MRRFIPILLLVAIVGAGYLFWLRQKEREQRDYLLLFGNVDVRQVELSFRVAGQLEKMNFQEGDLVSPGTIVAELDKQPYADRVLEAQANLNSIKASLENAKQLLTRRQELIADGSVSREDLEDAIAKEKTQSASLEAAEAALQIAKSNLSYTAVYAPIDGVILTRIREPGSVVNPAEPVYTLSINHPIWIRAFVNEPELGLVYPGMEAEIFTDTPGAPIYRGRVGFISPVAEFTPKTVESTSLRTDLVYRIRVYADNPDRGLRQGMPVTVRLKKTDERPSSHN